MPRPTAVSELQQKLFKRMGVDLPERQQWRKNRDSKGTTSRGTSSGPLSRKLQRKSARAQKKSDRYSGGRRTADHALTRQQQLNKEASRSQNSWIDSQKSHGNEDEDEGEGDEVSGYEQVEGNLESDGFSSEDQGGGNEEEDEDEDEIEDEDENEDDEGLGESDDHGSTNAEDSKFSRDAGSSKSVSSLVRAKLDQDDAEIDKFERKLGIKKGRKSLPQDFKDGLDELLGDIGTDASPEDQEDYESLKRKRDYDEWLSAKRRKTKPSSWQDHKADANAQDPSDRSKDHDSDDQSHDSHGWSEEGDDGDAFDEQSFDGFGSDDEGGSEQPQQRVKENPYKAPATGAVVAKYVPPSLRKTQGPDSEDKARLQKQLQGQINRLTEANILSIVQAIEGLYQNNARGDVTEVLTSIILAQMQSPDNLSDQFFVLTGGFSAAIYKVIGSSFGSHLVREVAKSFGQVYETCQKAKDDPSAIRKEASNMIAFLSQLYLFEVVGCKILFDYMERFLADLNELNVELLLRICRVAGQTLRKDDSNALKHVTSILSAAVAKVGYANVSARTKFMIETLNDLKSSKPKARGMDTSIVSDHVLRMRKRLGELKSRSRRFDGLAPMGVGLDDLEQADTAGKWWLVGASVPVKEGKKDSKSVSTSKTPSNDRAGLSDDEDMDFVLPDYPKKARDQGLNTMAQIAIFTAIMSAMNYEHGYQRYLGLGLKREDQLEIARVLVQCVGSESQYNEYYALVGRKACTNPKVKFAFQDRLWRIFRSFGESLFGDETEAEETADSERMKDERRISHVARFYASFVDDGAVAITILKPLNLPEMNEWTASFVEWFIIGLLRACRGKGPSKEAKIHKIFGAAAEIPSLAAGVSWFLRDRLRRTKLIPAEEVRKLDRAREKALAAIQGNLVARDPEQ